MESDIRFYRRRASEELAAAGRAVTPLARERRMALAGVFLDKLKALDAGAVAELCATAPDQAPVFHWANARSVERA